MTNYQNDAIEQKLISIIADAPNHILDIAQEQKNGKPDFDQLENGLKHRRLSQAWIKYLSLGLERYYREDLGWLDVYAFPGEPKLVEIHGIKRKEFLFDISVGKYAHFKSTVHGKDIYYQSEPIWQIESEFAYSMVEMVVDFSKLIAGNAHYKMMVGPVGKKKSEHYRKDMKHLAKEIHDMLYFLFIPRPHKWFNDRKQKNEESSMWHLHKWDGDEWVEVWKDSWKLKI